MTNQNSIIISGGSSGSGQISGTTIATSNNSVVGASGYTNHASITITSPTTYYYVWNHGVATPVYPDDDWQSCDTKYIEKPLRGSRELKLGNELHLTLPDKSILKVDAEGNFVIDDSQAQVLYKANRSREFSPHLNASDLLAKFIRYLGTLGIKQQEVLSIPVGLFINWLIIEAAEAYNDPVPEDVVPVSKHPLLKGKIQPRCMVCKQFIRKISAQNGFNYCSPDHANIHFSRLKAA